MPDRKRDKPRSEVKRETQQREPRTPAPGPNPSQAEGDVKTVEEALRNKENRR